MSGGAEGNKLCTCSGLSVPTLKQSMISYELTRPIDIPLSHTIIPRFYPHDGWHSRTAGGGFPQILEGSIYVDGVVGEMDRARLCSVRIKPMDPS